MDLLVELDTERPVEIFEYARLKIYVNEIPPQDPSSRCGR